MSCLYLDSSRKHLKIALAHFGKFFVRENLENNHNETLLPCLQSLLIESRSTSLDIDRAIVVNGPGSFTGLRITTSFIHAASLVVNLKVLPIDQLTLIAAADRNRIRKNRTVVMDARMNEVYLASGLINEKNPSFEKIRLTSLECLPEEKEDWICHSEEQSFAQSIGVSVLVTPSIYDLEMVASWHDQSDWILGNELKPLYVRDEVSWKPLTEQPSQLSDG